MDLGRPTCRNDLMAWGSITASSFKVRPLDITVSLYQISYLSSLHSHRTQLSISFCLIMTHTDTLSY